MKLLLQYIYNEEYYWQLCVIANTIGISAWLYKVLVFLCEWDSRARHEHYLKNDWSKRSTLKGGTTNVKYTLLVEASKILLPLCILNWPNEKICKSDQSGWSSFPIHLQQVSCIKPSQAERRYRRWSLNQQAIKRWRLWSHLIWNGECCLECISRCGTQLSWKRKSTKLYWICGTHDRFLQNVGCNMSLKIHVLHTHLNFSFKLWWRKWRTWGAFPSGYCIHRKTLPRKMQPINISWLLLDSCSRLTRLVLQQES